MQSVRSRCSVRSVRSVRSRCSVRSVHSVRSVRSVCRPTYFTHYCNGICPDFGGGTRIAFRSLAGNCGAGLGDTPQYKYALYASRSLAVKHPPNFTCRGDAIFNKLLVSLPNMALYYTTRAKDPFVLEQQLVQPFFDLPDLKENRFDWDNFDLNSHEEITYNNLYKDAFQFPFLDLRLPPLGGVSLLGWEYKATPPLALAQMLYFQQSARKDVKSAYLLVSDKGRAYVASFDRKGMPQLYDHLGMEREPTENIVLIFNDKRVWYPLMERDDTRRDKNLQHLVAAYTRDNPPFPPA